MLCGNGVNSNEKQFCKVTIHKTSQYCTDRVDDYKFLRFAVPVQSHRVLTKLSIKLRALPGIGGIIHSSTIQAKNILVGVLIRLRC